ncbi:MAG: hypothetical protein EOO12_03450 [Chitinophagaceae bacterium]|nr:MAG: hypothetical protein EOO12_03450 [Chitinophagaceae bacterium]
MSYLSRALFGALFLALSLFASAQRNWRPGYVVNRDGDTLRGEIDDRKWSLTPASIAFRPSAQDPLSEYGVRQLNGFAVADGDLYAVQELEVDDAPVDMSYLVDITENRSNLRRVFLRRLYEGHRVSLYELQEASKTHFFIRDSSGIFSELQYRVGYIPGTRTIDTRRGFRNTLYLYVPDKESALAEAVRNAEYNSESLLLLFPKLNAEESLSRSERRQRTRGVRLQVFAGAGIVTNFDQLKSTPSMAQTPPEKSSADPLYIAGLELSEKNRLQHFFLRLAFSYSSFSYRGDVKLPTTTITYEARNVKTFRSGVSVNYQHHFGRLKAYLGPGVAFEYSKVDYTNIPQFQEYRGMVPQVGGGLRFGPVFIAADYRFPTQNRFLSGALLYAGFCF